MSSYTTFKVIKIIDEYSLVINGGITDDISLGDDIEIFLEGDEIKDPFNGDEILGTLDYIKETLEVTEVYTNFAVCKKFLTQKIHHPSALQKALAAGVVSSGLSGLSGTTETKITEEKIKVAKGQMTGRKTGDNIIRIGDLARIALSD
ncbi:hypothetical protein [Peribacillus sp. AS_2]|uniref:hypothetical protein n=1 Tax=Peribacillus sp. AS_2 TaxID=2996755 RepID=UPI0022A6CE64|nr:hypothetical protein [Peribacillus sp. AS_2]MCZ0875630.1 hypothetical protein [Peribacillus sp. AS_2]